MKKILPLLIIIILGIILIAVGNKIKDGDGWMLVISGIILFLWVLGEIFLKKVKDDPLIVKLIVFIFPAIALVGLFLITRGHVLMGMLIMGFPIVLFLISALPNLGKVRGETKWGSIRKNIWGETDIYKKD